MYKFYDINESQLTSKDFEAEALYFCNDTGNLFMDSIAEQERIAIAKDIVICATETAKPLAPLPGKLYAVIATGKLYIYNGEWISLGGDDPKLHLHFKNITVTDGTLEIAVSGLTSEDTAVFVPDLSVEDLVTNISAVCSDGKVTVTLTSDYDIPGEVIIN